MKRLLTYLSVLIAMLMIPIMASAKDYYLVGNFMSTDGTNINYNNRIFLMKYKGNNQYTFDVPATITVYSQILVVDGSTTQAYGPTSNQTSGPNNDGTINGDLTTASAKTNNYWKMSDRGINSDGMYTYTITVNSSGVPTSWTIKHTRLTRVVYFLPKDGVAQPAYMTRNNTSSSGDNKYFGNVYLNEGQECFVLGNIKGKSAWTDSGNPMPTVTKLYKQGNGGGYVVGDGTNPTHPSGYDDWHKVYPALSSGFKVKPAGALTLEYNPSLGQDEKEAYSGNNNIGGEVKRAIGDPMVIIKSMKVIGPGVDTDWTLSNARSMTYNETLKCWEITITTTNAASTANLFRFVANDSWTTNWYEDGTAEGNKAKIPYNGTGLGHAATDADPNVVEKTSDAHATTARDIIFNRPAGTWTIRFYIETVSSSGGNFFTYNYYYTITGTESPAPTTLDFTPKGGLFINSAKITVIGGTEPYTYTVKDGSGNVRSTGKFVLDGNVDDDNYRISTPGILTVTDANGNTATSTELFDFTYSTSENYKNYNNNATVSKIIQTGGGQGALNVFINKNDDLETLWLYAYNKTLDTKLKNDGETDQDKIDKQVRLTDAFPGNDMTKAPTITIDGIKYVHFTIPEGNLREGDKVAIIVSQGTEDKQYWWTQTTDTGIEIERTEDPAFIYNIKNSPSGTPSSGAQNHKGDNTLLQMVEDGSRTIFFTKPSGWTAPIYCHSWIPNTTTETKWKATNEKMTVYDNNIYTYTVPNGMTKVMFVDANGNKTKDGGTDYNGGRIHYTWNGSTLNSTPATYAADLTELTTFLNTPPTTTVVTQRYPNGEDYWRAAPGDLSIKLDPTWGITGGLAESSTLDWAGNKPKKVNANQVLTQTIQGLNAGKTYTVQAIVGGLGEDKKTVTLTLEGAETVEKTINLRNGGSENSADLSRQGSEITKTGRVEYIEPLNFEGMNKYDVTKAGGWAKVEAKVKASQAGWLTISLTGDKSFDLSQVTLLEDANTTHGFRTTASETALSTGDSEETHTFDYRARDISRGWKKNNAYSFFDRGKNRNAVIFANYHTVIAMNPDLLADVPQNAALKAVDRRHPFNVVGSDENDVKVGTAKALYLTDMGYGDDAENPVDYKIGDSTWATYNSTNYRKSGYTFQPYLAFNAEDVILDRTPGVAEKKQTTIMLPFGISVDEMKEYYGTELRVWDYQSYDEKNKTITFNEVKDNLTANQPYILTGANGMLDSRGKNKAKKTVAQVVNTTHHTASDHKGFTGTYEYTLISRGDANETHYGYNPTTGKFQIAAKGGAALKPFRAYFTLPIPLDEQYAAPYFTVIFDDVSTGISTVEQAEVEDNNVYTISGMYVGKLGADKLHKGVYIVNGKKYVVK